MNRPSLILVFLLSFFNKSFAEDGYRLWLKYDKVQDQKKLSEYRNLIKGFTVEGQSETLSAAREELRAGLSGLLSISASEIKSTTISGLIVCGTPSGSPLISAWNQSDKLKNLGDEGFIISSTVILKKKVIVIAANTDVGVLYGVFHFLKLIQTSAPIHDIFIESSPKVKVRILNHWDNLDGTVERGYAGFSIFNWHKLPDYLDPRYKDYARANASIGINGSVVTNVNASAFILTPDYLKKVAALASVFRPYGIKIYLSARFSAPIEIGNLKTADPLDPEVRKWWKSKADEIYQFIPDFGGFVVKANSEGQPGPQNYGRSHAEGANMLAEALLPHKGIVMWRAFVYDDKNTDDRAKQAFSEFKPLDGKFLSNVIIQVKNGAIDFQPREPFHPLFGAMPQTPLMMEFQITQEYLGFSTHLVYLAPLFKETLSSDTHTKGNGSTVARIVDGSVDGHSLTGMAGVANIGTDRNWCGHPFAQANWYAFGRLAWDHTLTSQQIAEEWIRMTFTNEKDVITSVSSIMQDSRETCVSYMTPLGLHHIMGWSHHYGPGPWIKDKQRADWTSVYYHKTDTLGIGFDRTATGSNAISQYHPGVQKEFALDAIADQSLLWFHHVSWNYKLKSGQPLWEAMCLKYQSGVNEVRKMKQSWESIQSKIDETQYHQVRMLLSIQEKEAIWWKDACLLYFQTFSRRPFPAGVEKPVGNLDYYMKLEFPYAPGIRPKW